MSSEPTHEPLLPPPVPPRIPLNPSDYFFYSHHRMMQQRREGGNIAFMVMDVDGHVDPRRVRTILARGFLIHPVLMAPLRIALVSGRPYWRIPRDRFTAARDASAKAHLFEDFRGRDDAELLADQRAWSRYTADWNLKSGPQFRLEQYVMPGNRTRIIIRWPHLLMDAAGALWFLAEMARLSSTDDARHHMKSADGLRLDHEILDPLSGISFARRLYLLLRGFFLQRGHRSLVVRTHIPPDAPPLQDQGHIHRSWEGEQAARIRELARQRTPGGPALYARYMAACVFRALHRLYTERGIETDAYLITMPLSIFDFLPPGSAAARPVPGNYLVSPTLRGHAAKMGDKFALGEDIQRQLQLYRESRTPLSQWALVWAAGASRTWFYQWLMRLPMGLEKLASGFSFYGELQTPIRTFCGADVTNLWGGGPLPTPPGWNPVFSRFADKLNLSLSYSRPVIEDALARRYVQLIESEVLEIEAPPNY